MILVDSSVWVDHLRANDQILVRLLQDGRVPIPPFVLGELALGNLRQRATLLADLQDLPQATGASDREVLRFNERYELFGLGVDYVDVHLLAAVRLTLGSSLWTRDKRLHTAAEHLGLAARFSL